MTDRRASTNLSQGGSLRDHFLLAMPGLSGGFFGHTLTYICEHDEHGAMGIVLNNSLNLMLSDVFEQLEIECADRFYSMPVMSGGPVQVERGFVLHSGSPGDWEASQGIAEGITLSASLDILRAIATESGPRDFLIALGYAGWGAGQLERELMDNSWLTHPGDSGIIFHTPCEQRLGAAAASLGIDFNLLSDHAGHG